MHVEMTRTDKIAELNGEIHSIHLLIQRIGTGSITLIWPSPNTTGDRSD